MNSLRSFLFVPANDRRRLERAHERGSDAIILDLEDGVGPADKAEARAGLAGAVQVLSAHGMPVIVRINAEWLLAIEDLRAAVLPGVTAIMAPKVEDRARVGVLSQIIGEIEVAQGRPAANVGLIALIESPAGLLQLSDIVAEPRVAGLALGVEDFALQLGVEPHEDNLVLPCQAVALAAAIRGIAAIGAPGPLSTFKDTDGFAAAVARASRMGMTGALCIHPSQVTAANQAFGPGERQIAEARDILAAWALAKGGVTNLNGRMIDLPLVRRAEATIVASRRP